MSTTTRRQTLGRELDAARRAGDWKTVEIVRKALARLTEDEGARELAGLVKLEASAAAVVARRRGEALAAERGLARGAGTVAQVRAAEAKLDAAQRLLADVQMHRSLCALALAGLRQRIRTFERGERWEEQWGPAA